MKLITRIIAISLVFWMMPAVASDFYMNIAGAQTIIETDAGKAKPFIGAMKLGYEFTPNFAFEVQYGAGTDKDQLDNQEYEINSLAAAFLRFSSSGSYSDVRLYLLLGYSQFDMQVTAAGTTVSDTYDGFSYGVGAEEFLKSVPNLAFVAEYVWYYDRDELSVDAITLGIRYKF